MKRFFLATVLIAASAHAQVHMCRQPDGRKIYSDLPCGPDERIVDVRPASGGATAYAETSQTIHYFDIRGATAAELQREVAAKGPEGRWGDELGHITYEVRTKRVAGGCAIDSVRARSDATVRLPRWLNRGEGSAELQWWWDGWVRTVDLHERGHVRISFEAAQQIERSLGQMEPQPTCAALQAKAKGAADAIFRQENERQANYDADTQHGLVQWTPYR
jgi:predicted secreted Zn-dependent protease